MSGRDITAARQILSHSRIDDLGEAIIALTREIWVITDRMTVLETILGENGIDTSKIDEYQPDEKLSALLQERRQRLIDNLLVALKAD